MEMDRQTMERKARQWTGEEEEGEVEAPEGEVEAAAPEEAEPPLVLSATSGAS